MVHTMSVSRAVSMNNDAVTEKSVNNDSTSDQEYVPPSIPVETGYGLRLSALNPKYLHTNSTSHTWPFSAIAELVDNAYDPDVKASQLHIDLEIISRDNEVLHESVMSFTDNGSGMTPDKLYKMLSFGFCEKVTVKGHIPVGHYGNGFKSGTMRIGKDALVFTKNAKNRSVGFLSQTYLFAVNADTIIVPMVTWDNETDTIIRSEEEKCSLPAILKYSVIDSMEKINHQFSCIKSESGTRILISNLRKTGSKLEFDIVSDKHDIKIPEDIADSEEGRYKREERQQHIPASDYSLRAYLSILYLKPKMQIYLRKKKVKTVVIRKSLSKTEVDVYRPFNEKPMKIVFGFSENINHYGIMMYHSNRLIKPYVRVGCQLKANNMGVGVIGVIECNSLQPTHNKQDFDYTSLFRATMTALGCKLNDYWNEKTINGAHSVPQLNAGSALPDELWVQCDNTKCLKWRKLPEWVKKVDLPDKWYCHMHPDPVWATCSKPEEEDESQAIITPYEKKLKKRARQLKEMERMKLARRKEAELHLEKFQREREAMKLRRQEEEINRLRQQLSSETSQLTNHLTTEFSRNMSKSHPDSSSQQSTPHHNRTNAVIPTKILPNTSQHLRISNPIGITGVTSNSQNSISNCSPVVNGDLPIVSEVFSIKKPNILQKPIKVESTVYGGDRLYSHSVTDSIGSKKRPISLDSEDEEEISPNKVIKTDTNNLPECIDLDETPEQELSTTEAKPDLEQLAVLTETDIKPEEGAVNDKETNSRDSSKDAGKIDQDILDSLVGLDTNAAAGLLAKRTQDLRNLRNKIYNVSKILFPDVDFPNVKSVTIDDSSIEDFLDGIIDSQKNTDFHKESS